MYTATILKSAIDRGVLTVTVVFKNDKGDEFYDHFTTSQKQEAGWIEGQVSRKLAHLNALPSLHETIEAGKVITLETGAESIHGADAAREEYRADLARFEKFVGALAKGFTTKENADFVALKKKLTENFKPEYLDLF